MGSRDIVEVQETTLLNEEREAWLDAIAHCKWC